MKKMFAVFMGLVLVCSAAYGQEEEMLESNDTFEAAIQAQLDATEAQALATGDYASAEMMHGEAVMLYDQANEMYLNMPFGAEEYLDTEEFIAAGAGYINESNLYSQAKTPASNRIAAGDADMDTADGYFADELWSSATDFYYQAAGWYNNAGQYISYMISAAEGMNYYANRRIELVQNAINAYNFIEGSPEEPVEEPVP